MEEILKRIEGVKKKLSQDIESIQGNNALGAIEKYDLSDRTYEAALAEFQQLKSDFIMKRSAELSALVRKAFRAPVAGDEPTTEFLIDRYSKLIEKYKGMHSDLWNALETIALIGDKVGMLALVYVLRVRKDRPDSIPQGIYDAALSDYEMLFPAEFKPIKELVTFEKTWMSEDPVFPARPQPPKKPKATPKPVVKDPEPTTDEAAEILRKGGK